MLKVELFQAWHEKVKIIIISLKVIISVVSHFRIVLRIFSFAKLSWLSVPAHVRHRIRGPIAGSFQTEMMQRFDKH